MRILRAAIVAAISAIPISHIASAADMPTKAPAYAPPVAAYDWSGFYIGGHVGAAWGGPDGSFSQINTPPFDPSQYDPKNFGRAEFARLAGGVHGGFNWMVMPNWLLGLEGDFTWTSRGVSSASTPATLAGVVSNTNRVNLTNEPDWLSTVRGRFGYTANNILFYATGGVAWTETKYAGFISNALINANVASIGSRFSNTSTGWVAGGGLEYMLTQNWLLRGEYLYYDFPNQPTAIAPCTRCVPGSLDGPGVFTWNNSHFSVVRFGVSYKFGGLALAKN
jgi:outer membrane immunogenic protein